MPVGLLLCEGAAQSPDVRLLSALVGDLRLAVRPAGDKHALHHRVLARREILGASTQVAAIRDCDFDFDPPEDERPGDLTANNQAVLIGWHWKRVEVENYLVDPIIVTIALKLSADVAAEYAAAFATAAESLADYTAARYALSRSRPRWMRLENRWGESAGLKDHLLPTQRDDMACKSGIYNSLSHYREHIPAQNDVIDRYEQARIDYASAGLRGRQPEVYYSGKDLLCALGPACNRLGFGNPGKFRELMLRTIESSPEPAWEWLPEWRELRRLLQSGAEPDRL